MSEQSEDVTADVGGQLFLGRIDIPPFGAFVVFVVGLAVSVPFSHCDRAVLLTKIFLWFSVFWFFSSFLVFLTLPTPSSHMPLPLRSSRAVLLNSGG